MDDIETPERRVEDGSLVVGVAVAVVRWWRAKAGLISKTLSAGAAALSILAMLFAAGAGVFALYARWEGVPARVGELERTFAHHRDSVTIPALARLEAVEAATDSLDRDVSGVQSSLEDVGEAVDDLRDIAFWNNCLLRVQAGEISRFECGPEAGRVR